MKKLYLIVGLIIMFFIPHMNTFKVSTLPSQELLPPPIAVNMTLEKSIFRRCSIRIFSDEPVSEEELSTILWAAYGYIEIGQNIYFMANALDLGTVTTVGFTLSQIGLPPSDVPKIIMPIGHPKYPYNFVYCPLVFSLLPRIQYSNMSLTDAIEERREAEFFGGELTKQEEFQVIWSTYGYSYLLDKTKDEFYYHINRHRTVPSAHGYYPLRIYVVKESGIYRYIPNIYDPIYGIYLLPFSWFPIPVVTFMMKIKSGDYRDEIAQASSPSIATAPLIIVSVLDIERTRPKGFDDFSGEEFRWLWYYEAGASAYNALLESTAWGLSANVFPIVDKGTVLSVLGLNGDDFDPLFIVAVGK